MDQVLSSFCTGPSSSSIIMLKLDFLVDAGTNKHRQVSVSSYVNTIMREAICRWSCLGQGWIELSVSLYACH